MACKREVRQLFRWIEQCAAGCIRRHACLRYNNRVAPTAREQQHTQEQQGGRMCEHTPEDGDGEVRHK